MKAEEGVGREAMGGAEEGGDRRQVEVPAAEADSDAGVGPTLTDRTIAIAMTTSMATMTRSELESVRVGVRREVRVGVRREVRGEVRVWVRVRVEWRQKTCDWR